MAPLDPHSYADGESPLTTHVALTLYLDFATCSLHGSALLTLSAPHSGPLSLDTRSLTIHSAIDPTSLSPIPFSLSAPDPVLGSRLSLSLPSETPLSSILLSFSTSSSSALHFLSPSQAASPFPYAYTQCQSIHARSLFPCHDTPAARIRFSALLNIPSSLSAVMAARHHARRDPIPSEGGLSLPDSLWCAPGRIVEQFFMEQPIPPYLFAFAVGHIVFRDIGPRTRVYAGPDVVGEAAREFAGTEEMIRAGEKLFGPYDWERFDLLVLPMSFPYGGMENPRMVFLTPTVIKGDAAGAQVVAHELAHSWTGNLITNKTNEDFWLNEGFTTYAERRIVEVVQGEERAALNMGIGWRGLNRTVERFRDNMEFTKLKPCMQGVDPDDVYSEIPYEKGFQFLWLIERQVGRPVFDEFTKKYISTFKFQSIDTETFIDFLKANVPGIENQIDLRLWVEGTGIPPDAMEPVSAVYNKIKTLASEFKNGQMPGEDEVAQWNGQEWELYLENLSANVDPSQALALDARYRLSESRDWEVKVAFLELAISTGCKEYYAEAERSLKQVGRMKYLRPLYTALAKCSEEGKMLACRIYAESRNCYHPIAQGVVESILSKHA
ncbi:Leukotriene A-4 hydrolase-like protein [Rhynchospora pubera]|uniref:Leucine aminopeptidase n=1 Tax=Rhynchospora pubera TaxID=906938 RepID=A0AAV8ENS9_9POAL|nr:Leukotriene A-4 hydrolase-like protein [Rhynchospora pubera]